MEGDKWLYKGQTPECREAWRQMILKTSPEHPDMLKTPKGSAMRFTETRRGLVALWIRPEGCIWMEKLSWVLVEIARYKRWENVTC